MMEDKPLIGSVNVRQYDELTVAGKTYWKISQKDNEYILASTITKHVPSKFGGTRLGDDTGWGVPFASVAPRGGMQEAWTTNKAGGGGVARQLAARTPVPISETQTGKDGKPVAYRIGDAEWIAVGRCSGVRARAAARDAEPRERWIDVDLDKQILVAFEGDNAGVLDDWCRRAPRKRRPRLVCIGCG